MRSIIQLPDGQTFAVQPVFSGLLFTNNQVNHQHTPFPAGWTVVLHTEEVESSPNGSPRLQGDAADEPSSPRTHIRTWKQPTLQDDAIFISSISNPSSTDYEPALSPARQTALMLWIALYWYFQKPEPSPQLSTAQSQNTPADGRPKGGWRIRVKRDGVFRHRNMIPKLERMGLISTLDSAVGTSTGESAGGWDQMFVTRQAFWQIPTNLFLYTLQHRRPSSNPGSPINSRPNSPVRSESSYVSHKSHVSMPVPAAQVLAEYDALSTTSPTTPTFATAPLSSSSRLPTHYPPPPLQYRTTNGVRHPVRPKPPRMGEIFYSRFVPSVGKYLAFRVASASSKPVPYLGAIGPNEHEQAHLTHLTMLSDTALLEQWFAKPRVSNFWGTYQPDFLPNALRSQHSFPAIGLWDGVPFGYFEIYWVKEDILGQQMGRDAEEWDRGFHVIIGEEWSRGRAPFWISSLVHWCWQADNRTNNVMLEPRVDNARYV